MQINEPILQQEKPDRPNDRPTLIGLLIDPRRGQLIDRLTGLLIDLRRNHLNNGVREVFTCSGRREYPT